MQKLNKYKFINVINYGKNSSIICPICQFYASSSEESNFVLKNNVCLSCYDNFRFSNYDKWNEGWRPTLEEARNKLNIYSTINIIED
jgi:hypothetical protein